jgi:hypothetical protein
MGIFLAMEAPADQLPPILPYAARSSGKSARQGVSNPRQVGLKAK